MLKNYFKTLFRNMQKNKLDKAINVIGMAVAFTCGILLLLFVYQQFTFNKFHANGKQLYMVYNSYSSSRQIETSVEVEYSVAPAVKAAGIGIEKSTRHKNAGRGARYKDKEPDLQINIVDDDFFSMFSFPVVRGNKLNPLAETGNAVISSQQRPLCRICELAGSLCC